MRPAISQGRLAPKAVAGPVVDAGLLFASANNSGLGTGTAAIYDTSAPVPWVNDGVNTPNGVCAVVDNSALTDGDGVAMPSAPDGIAAVFQITRGIGGAPSGHRGVTPDLRPSIAVGQSLFMSLYFMETCTDDQPLATSSFTSGHPFETGQLGNASSTEEIELEIGAYGTAHGKPGKLAFATGILNNPGDTRYRPGPDASFGYDLLSKFVWYRWCMGVTKAGTNLYTIEDIRIYNAATRALQYDMNSMYNNNGNGLLVSNRTGKTFNDNRIGRYHLGSNGGGNWQTLTKIQKAYFGPFVVRSDAFPDPYNPARGY